ncbi:MAG: recombination protein RecR [Candidatus Omnitrophica bacterium]|nr:recombination protein RecR [Candidatus Omnitrophota bacterium]
MNENSDSLKKLIEEFTKLPGIGPKSAQRLAMHVLKGSMDQAKALAFAIVKAKQSLRYCEVCNNLTEEKICPVCQDQRRDKSTICVVEEPKDVLAIEKSASFNGIYHVLLGALSPLDGVEPKDLKIDELLDRIRQSAVKEVIIATDSDSEGEATALYLVQLIKPLGIKISRIACGIPAGGNLEYADQTTLGRALQGRLPL